MEIKYLRLGLLLLRGGIPDGETVNEKKLLHGIIRVFLLRCRSNFRKKS
jgi:hypothetical protein